MTARPASIAAALVLLLTGACGSDGSDDAARSDGSSPERAVAAVMAGMEAGDCDDVKAVVVTPDAIDCEAVETLRGAYAADGVDLDDVDLSAGDRSGSSVTVTADLGGEADPETWQVEKTGGSWKVLFDSEE